MQRIWLILALAAAACGHGMHSGDHGDGGDGGAGSAGGDGRGSGDGGVPVGPCLVSGFPSVAWPTTGRDPTSVAVADFDGDGHPDLAVTDYLDNDVSVLLDDGGGGR